MTGVVVMTAVTEEPLDLSAHVAAVGNAAAGATVSFAGVVRDHDGGRSVAALHYEAHPSAARVIAQVAAEIADREGIIAVTVSHRFGSLTVGDIALAAAVSAAHRGAAFAACSDLVDEVKRRIPIWKRQVFSDGTEEWVGSA